jgi:radical SAM protein with 4Fe4S-binding SPASM domain
MLAELRYQRRFYATLRAANRAYDPARDMAAASFPRLIQIQTINACQAACTMCPYPLFKDAFPRGRMDDALFEKVLAELAERPEVETVIPMLQNEPLLDKRLFDRLRAVKERTRGRVTTELVTNGALLTDEVVERIRDARLDILDVSLDALSREVYGRVRVGLDYDVVLAGVERVLRARLPDTTVFVRLVRVRDNAAEVKAFARHWRKRGVPVFVYTANNRVGALPEFDERLRVRGASALQRLGRRAVRAWLGHCPAAFASANILHDGSVLVCTHDWARKEVVGNVRAATLAEIWNGERMREIRRLIRERRYAELPACRECSLWKDGWV